MMPGILPTYFISHGGGPWPWLDGPIRQRYAVLEQSLQDLPHQIGHLPRAVLMITAHWVANGFVVGSSPKPPMIYDYGGFPDHTYQISYAAPGSPALANRVAALLTAGGLACREDPARGFDHGTFSIMQVMRPEEDLPIVQLSIDAGYDPRQHFEVGRLLAPLRAEDVLIIGSGLSYHNLRRFGPQAAVPSREFDDWLQQTLVRSTPPERLQRLVHWSQAPSARVAHPQEDHLIPLMVAVGAAEDETGTCVYHEDEFFGGISVSNFRFG